MKKLKKSSLKGVLKLLLPWKMELSWKKGMWKITSKSLN